MKYIILQEKTTGEIRIVDNNNKLGKRRAEMLCQDGFVLAGTIESDLKVSQLKTGFEYIKNRKLDDANLKISKIWDILNN